MFPNEFLEWRDFELFNGGTRTGVVSVKCCKIRYSKPFSNRCIEALPKSEEIIELRIRKIAFNSATRIEGIRGMVLGNNFSETFDLVKGTTVWC